MERCPVTGIVLFSSEVSQWGIYISGDTVWFEGIAEVGREFQIKVALPFLGAARVEAFVPWPLTMTSDDALATARAFSEAIMVPLHYEGWTHFSESRSDVVSAFTSAGLRIRLLWFEPGLPTEIDLLC